MLVIRGNNVFPTAIEGIVRQFAEVAEFRLAVVRGSALEDLRIEIEPRSNGDPAGLARNIAELIRDRLNFRPEVVPVGPGTLPRFEMKARRIVWEQERSADE